MDLELLKVLGKIVERLDAIEERLDGAPAQPEPTSEPIPPPVLVTDFVEAPAVPPPSVIGEAFRNSRALAAASSLPVGMAWDVIGDGIPDIGQGRGSGRGPEGHMMTDAQIRAAYERDQRAKVFPRTIEDVG